MSSYDFVHIPGEQTDLNCDLPKVIRINIVISLVETLASRLSALFFLLKNAVSLLRELVCLGKPFCFCFFFKGSLIPVIITDCQNTVDINCKRNI